MRRWGLASAVYVALSGVLLLPLLRQFGSAYPHDAGDPVLNTWLLWWSTRAVPLSTAWWNAPMFHPASDVMALSELLIGLLPMSSLVQAVAGNPVAAYNAVFALSFPLCGLAAYGLAREITGRTDAALVAGLAFMLAPYRVAQLSHVQVLSYYWAPVVLYALHRYHRDRRTRWLVLFGAAWLLQALSNGYALFHLSVLVGLWLLWFMRPVRTMAPVLVAWACAAVPLVPILWHYRAVHESLHLVRDITEIRRFGADLADFAAAPADLLIWGGRLGLPRPESALFPGVTLIGLAVAALIRGRRIRLQADVGAPAEAGAYAPVESAPAVPDARWCRLLVLVSMIAGAVALSTIVVGPWAIGPLTVRDFHKPFSIAVAARLAAFLAGGWVRSRWRGRSVGAFYLLAMGAMYILALGPEPRMLGRPLLYEPPYAWLMRLPGFDALRVPVRFVMLAALCQAVLVSMALASWARGSRRVPLLAVVTIGLVLDGWTRLPVAAAPAASNVEWRDVAAVAELPLGTPEADFGPLFRSMQHGLPIVNGYSGYAPAHYLALAHAVRDGHVEALRELGAGRLGLLVDRTRVEVQQIERGLQTAGRLADGGGRPATAFIVEPSSPPPDVPLGQALPIVLTRVVPHGEDAGRMLDHDVGTAWGSGTPQIGGEEVLLDLGSDQSIGAVVLEMGAFAFGHPRSLDVDISSNGADWQRAWTGDTSVLTVRGAVRDPVRAPLVIPVAATGRYIRLQQTGNEPGIPWWIAELGVFATAR